MPVTVIVENADCERHGGHGVVDKVAVTAIDCLVSNLLGRVAV